MDPEQCRLIDGSIRAGRSATTDFPTSRKFVGDTLVCPEQRDSMAGGPRRRHRASCAVCWQASRGITFIEH